MAFIRCGGGGNGMSWDYSTDEVNTGQKWIDGKDIYCKVIVPSSPVSITGNQWANLALASDISSNLNEVIDCYVIDDTYHANYNGMIAILDGYLKGNFGQGGKAYKIIVFYTKVIHSYTDVSYIKSDGSSYINTALRFTTNTEFEIGGRWDSIPQSVQIFFGIWESGGESLYGCLNEKYWAQIGGTGTANAIAVDTTYHVFSADANGIYIDGNSIGTPNWNNVPTGYDIPILARQDGGSGVNCQAPNFELEYCKIWQGGTLVRDMRPVSR